MRFAFPSSRQFQVRDMSSQGLQEAIGSALISNPSHSVVTRCSSKTCTIILVPDSFNKWHVDPFSNSKCVDLCCSPSHDEERLYYSLD